MNSTKSILLLLSLLFLTLKAQYSCDQALSCEAAPYFCRLTQCDVICGNSNECETCQCKNRVYMKRKDPNAFNVEILSQGNGQSPRKGNTVKVHYTGKLTNGKVFDSSVQRNQPFQFTLGAGQVISCWDQGISQLQKGQKAVLTCPYNMAYGERGYPPVIPRKATLIFEVELLDFY